MKTTDNKPTIIKNFRDDGHDVELLLLTETGISYRHPVHGLCGRRLADMSAHEKTQFDARETSN